MYPQPRPFTIQLCCRWCSQRPLLPQSLHLFLHFWCSQSAGALWGFLALPLVLAEAAATAVSALASHPLVLAEAAATAVFALAPHPLVLAEAAAAAVFALAPHTRWCSQIPLLPQSLHWLRNNCEDCGRSSICKYHSERMKRLQRQQLLRAQAAEEQVQSLRWERHLRTPAAEERVQRLWQEENAGGARRATKEALQARRAWCEPSQCIRPGHSSGATSFYRQEVPSGPCAL